jgi:ubiquinone/menaquinone biosynthesis C-methylase UbiE
MGRLRNFVTSLHQSSARDYLGRMLDGKVHCMGVAKKYEEEYWDGDRRYGYGGYSYRPGYWKPVAQQLISTYGLKAGSKMLDLGCGKGYLLHEMLLLEPGLEICGMDISRHGMSDATDLVKPFLVEHDARDGLEFADNHFDLVISITTLHNLEIFDLARILPAIERVGQKGYVVVESYRNDQELFSLQCWALTCQAFFNTREWEWLFGHFGYHGDFEFIYFE